MPWNRGLLLLCGVGGVVPAVLVYAWNLGANTPAAPQPQTKAEAALPEILGQVYSAFALEDEEQIYDALEGAVAGDLIGKLYLQRRKAQVADHAEDGDAAILAVEVYEVTPLAQPGAYAVDWRVIGRLRHTNHVHERINLYSADITVSEFNGKWKLSAFDLTNSTRSGDLPFTGGE